MFIYMILTIYNFKKISLIQIEVHLTSGTDSASTGSLQGRIDQNLSYTVSVSLRDLYIQWD